MDIIIIKSFFKQSIPEYGKDLGKKGLDLLVEINIAGPLVRLCQVNARRTSTKRTHDLVLPDYISI